MSDINEITGIEMPDNSVSAVGSDIKNPPKGVKEKQKGGFFHWLVSHFFAMSAKDIAKGVFENVVDPGLRQFTSNVIDEAKNLLLFGEEGSSGGGQYVRYSAKSSGPAVSGPSKSDKMKGNFTNVEYMRREDALDVRRRLLERLAECREVTVAFFYDASDVESDSTDYNWGWTQFPNGLNVIPTSNGKYKLNLPPAKALAK